MAAVWQGRAAALFVLLAVLANWFSGAGDSPAWVRLVAILTAFAATVVLYNRRHLVNVVRVLPRDLRYVVSFLRAGRMISAQERRQASACRVFEELVDAAPDKACFLLQDERWTYRDVDEYSNRVARAFLRAGVRHGDVVALLMGNRVEFVCLWLGLAKIGAVTALINWNLRGAALAHTINVARAKVAICAEGLVGAVQEVRADLPTVEKWFRFGGADGGDDDGWVPLLPLLAVESAERPAVDRAPAYTDAVLYIYTSGTTGLPKAAIITHAKLLFWPIGIQVLARLDPAKDVHYCSLPLYHTAGGAYATALALTRGITVALAAKFSASRFFADAARHGATTAQYIGELCRFLVLSSEGGHDRRHGVRTLIGNGMSPAVWRRTQARFGVPEIIELYGSTEGNVMLVNYAGKVGSMGFMPLLLPRAFWPMDLVRVDADTMEPLRDDVTGLCVRCKAGEPGMMLGKIREGAAHAGFIGYLDKEATAKKVLRDVFDLGDRYFLSGDLAVMDELGFMYFKDRTGDTFRWKGENVSTTEVEAVLTAALLPLGVREVAVYGVLVPEHDGRAGMAAIADPEGRADAAALAALAAALERRLPRYARPLFVRVAAALPMTGTHKVSKVQLQREGFLVDDPVYVFDAQDGRYVRLTETLLDDIRQARMRL